MHTYDTETNKKRNHRDIRKTMTFSRVGNQQENNTEARNKHDFRSCNRWQLFEVEMTGVLGVKYLDEAVLVYCRNAEVIL